MEFSRQECWSGLPFPTPGVLPDPGIESRDPSTSLASLALAGRVCTMQLLGCRMSVIQGPSLIFSNLTFERRSVRCSKQFIFFAIHFSNDKNELKLI